VYETEDENGMGTEQESQEEEKPGDEARRAEHDDGMGTKGESWKSGRAEGDD
jgi:hypothetical protein